MILIENQRPNGCVNTALGLTETEQGAFDMADAAITDSVEIWKSVPGWEGLYSISNLGNVRSEPKTVNVLTRWGHKSPRRWPAKLLTQQTLKGRGRYKLVHFKKDGYREAHYVHRLVCRAFHGEPPTAKHETAHFDGTRDNNRADNLRWATHEENQMDRVRHGTMKRKAGSG